MENLNKVKKVVKKLWYGIKAIPKIGAKILKESGQILFITFLIVGCTSFVISAIVIANTVGKWVFEAKATIETAWELRGIEPEIRGKAVKNALEAQEEIEKKRQVVTEEGLKKYFLNGDKIEASETKNVDLSRLKIKPKEGQEIVRWVTAYNCIEEQTDETPDFAEPTRNNLAALYDPLYKEKELYICASNAYPLGTVLQIRTKKGIFGKCINLDRMKSNHKGVDVYFDDDVQRAKGFGKQKLWIKQIGIAEGFQGMAPIQ